MSDIVTRDKAESLIFELSMEVSNRAPIDYALHLDINGEYYDISTEILVQERQYIDRHDPDVSYYDALTKKFIQLYNKPRDAKAILEGKDWHPSIISKK